MPSGFVRQIRGFDDLPFLLLQNSNFTCRFPPSLPARPPSSGGPDRVPKEDLLYEIMNIINGKPLSEFTLERKKVDYFYESRDTLRFRCV